MVQKPSFTHSEKTESEWNIIIIIIINIMIFSET